MGLSINDSVYSSIFFFLTGLHFFHLVVGLLLLSLLSWSCSFSSLTGLLQLQEEDLIEEEDCKRQDNERNVFLSGGRSCLFNINSFSLTSYFLLSLIKTSHYHEHLVRDVRRMDSWSIFAIRL